jgi:hypothetical protein
MNGKTTFVLLAILCLLGLAGPVESVGLVVHLAIAADSKDAAESVVVKAARRAVEVTQEKQTKFEQLYKNGIITLRELEHSRTELLEATIRLRKLKKDRAGVIEQLRLLLVVHQRQAQAAYQMTQKGVLDQKTLNNYQLKEAQVQVRLGLQIIVLIREKQVAELEIYYKRNLVTKKKVEDARETLSTALAQLRMVGSSR